MFFKRKHEFRPDKNRSWLRNLYMTKQQRLRVLKWLLITAALVFLSVVQDVIMSRISIFGTTTDLVPYGILLMCIILLLMVDSEEEDALPLLIAAAVLLFT